MCALRGPGPRQLTSAGKLPLAWGSPPSPLCLNYSGRLVAGTESGAPHPDLPQGSSLVPASGPLNASFMQSTEDRALYLGVYLLSKKALGGSASPGEALWLV